MEKKYLLFALCSFMTMSFVSCDNDDDPKPEIPTESSTTGVYFLNAGKLGSNNSTLDYYDPETKNLTTTGTNLTLGLSLDIDRIFKK